MTDDEIQELADSYMEHYGKIAKSYFDVYSQYMVCLLEANRQIASCFDPSNIMKDDD